MVKNSDVQKLKDEISRLMAALEDVNFECPVSYTHLTLPTTPYV